MKSNRFASDGGGGAALQVDVRLGATDSEILGMDLSHAGRVCD